MYRTLYFEVTGAQNWPYYLGPKRGKGQVCLTRQCLHPFLSRWRGLESSLLGPETVYYGDDALSAKPVSVMLIWAVLIPATRGHAIQSKVLAMITDCSANL